MIRNLILVSLLTLVNSVSFAQMNLNDSLLGNKLFTPYINYFNQEREWVYTHFNKSAYIQGDDIWFTSYVINPVNKLPNLATSKLYVELWTPGKKLIARKILYVEKGFASNYIHLPDSLDPGSYCFRAYTNWMRNFYPENDLITPITVLGHEKVFGNELVMKYLNKSVDKKEQTELSVESDSIPGYDIQFLPESGTFLEGVDNVFGIKALDPYGKGVRISGKVFSADNREINSFSTNESGMSNIIIRKASDQQYIAKVTLPDGTLHELKFPKAEHEGVIVHVDVPGTDIIGIEVQTNETTRHLNKQYLLMIHANGVLFNAFRVDFSKDNTLGKKISKRKLGRGIVYATLFDENFIPVAERIFYNRDTTVRGNLTVNVNQLANDTLNMKINVPDSLMQSQMAVLSIAVLPGETHLNHFNNSLLAESLLRPALRGNIENPNRFFEKNDIEHAVAIDNLLLTQGWRKYEWPAILTDTLPKFKYPFEDGFVIEGEVKNWMKNKPEQKSQITLLSIPNNLVLSIPADTVGKYRFDRLTLNDSTWVFLSASNIKGRNTNRVLQTNIYESFMGVPEIQPELISPEKPKEIIGDIPRLSKGTILLKEVTVKSQKKNPFARDINIGLMDKTFQITKDNYTQFNDMEMLLSSKFFIRTEMTAFGEYHFDMGRGGHSITQEVSEPRMMIDGVLVTNPQEILNFPIELVDAVAVNKSGLGLGMGGSAGLILIKSRTSPLFENNVEAANIKRLLVNGYAAPQQYFEPKYVIPPTSSDFEKFASVYWKPSLLIDKTKTGSFRFYAPQSIKSLSVRIEGISISGKIFLHEEKIEIPGRN
ncbi:MAG TPA: hypothetical protein VFC67_09845 [Prolixibacteraceae bacterium]|nr:hypothetical protein [Prolixibacteraceae bacterium]